MQKKHHIGNHNVILINVQPHQIRVARMQNSRLEGLHIENTSSPSLVGGIYKAKVIKNHLGNEACFVDIGFHQFAFLHDKGGNDDTGQISHPQQGQTVMVQVCKDAIKGKYPRVTRKMSIPGRFLIYLPSQDTLWTHDSPSVSSHVHVSRRIDNDDQRQCLKQQLSQWCNKESIIVRTLGANTSKDILKQEFYQLKNLWKTIQMKYWEQKSLGCVWKDVNLSARILRDHLTELTQNVLVDDSHALEQLYQFTSQYIPEFKKNITLYQESDTLFEKYDLEQSILRLLDKKVSLKSGGSLMIEETQAGVMIDVNTDHFVGTKDMESNILKINLEAACRLAYELRLRNCGGVIIIDFIDMQKEESRNRVMTMLEKELKKDSVYTQILPMSSLGIVQMTRKRTWAPLFETLCKPCFHCHGQAYMVREEAKN